MVFENFKGENMRWYFILFYFLQHVLALSRAKLLFSFPLLHTFYLKFILINPSWAEGNDCPSCQRIWRCFRHFNFILNSDSRREEPAFSHDIWYFLLSFNIVSPISSLCPEILLTLGHWGEVTRERKDLHGVTGHQATVTLLLLISLQTPWPGKPSFSAPWGPVGVLEGVWGRCAPRAEL